MLEVGFNGIENTVAMNPFQYENGGACGKCIVIYPSTSGIGMTPIDNQIFATIDNLCPECKDGDVDIGLSGDGRWQSTWEFVSCAHARKHAKKHTRKRNLRGFIQEKQ
jgi:hypothetical protein